MTFAKIRPLRLLVNNRATISWYLSTEENSEKRIFLPNDSLALTLYPEDQMIFWTIGDDGEQFYLPIYHKGDICWIGKWIRDFANNTTTTNSLILLNHGAHIDDNWAYGIR